MKRRADFRDAQQALRVVGELWENICATRDIWPVLREAVEQAVEIERARLGGRAPRYNALMLLCDNVRAAEQAAAQLRELMVAILSSGCIWHRVAALLKPRRRK